MLVIAEGKTKVIREVEGTNDRVLIESKDEITAGDGAKRAQLEGKAAYSTETTVNVLRLLDRAGVRTHFIGCTGKRTFIAGRAAMIPLELVGRRVATGSFLDRHPEFEEGTIFEYPMIEFFLKDDGRHDPLAVFDMASRRWLLFDPHQTLNGSPIIEVLPDISASHPDAQPLLQEQVEFLRSTTMRVFFLLEEAWERQGITFVDFKMECGFLLAGDGSMSGNIVVCDVIDNDSWRLWPGGDKGRQLDKQVFREKDRPDEEFMAGLAKNYARVAELTRSFLEE